MKKLEAKKLTKKFKPATLAPGVYQTDSSTRAYPAVRYLANTGKAELVREQFLGKGKVALVIRVHGASRNPIEGEFEETGHMRPTDEWMKNRTREYRDFKTAWWREVIQNSVDAGATRIELVCKEGPDGNWVVSCSDNGKGMTRDQVQDAQKGFLMFGGTSKTFSSTSTGAFGEAKQMLVLPWIGYRLLTEDKEYVGKGDEWGKRAAPMRKGVMLEVIMPADFHTTPEDAAFVLKRSWIPGITFLLNGKVVATGTSTPTDEKKKLDEIRDQGIIWEFPKRKDEAAEVIVRKNGIWMFSEEFPQSAKHSIIVEVTGPSTRMFTSNRDGFGGLADDLRSRIREMNAEVASEGKIRKKQRKPFEVFYRGTGQFSVGSPLPEREMELKEAMGPALEFDTTGKGTPFKKEDVETAIQMLNAFAKDDLDKLGERISRSRVDEGGSEPEPEETDTLMQIMMGSPDAARVIMGATMLKGQTGMDAAIKQIVWQPSFLGYGDEDLDYKIPSKFTPQKMTPAVLRLLKTWAELCRLILVQTGTSAEYGVGFWFSTDADAGYMYRKGQHWLMIDPHKDKSERKEIYNPANAEDLALMWAMAVHEVAHMIVQIRWGYTPDDSRPAKPAGHGSDLANTLTSLQSKLATSWPAVKKIASSIKLRGQIHQGPKAAHKPSLMEGRKSDMAGAENVAKKISNFVTLFHHNVIKEEVLDSEVTAVAYNDMLATLTRGTTVKRRNLASLRNSYPYLKWLYINDRVYDHPVYLSIRTAAYSDNKYVVKIAFNCEDVMTSECESLRSQVRDANAWIQDRPEKYPAIQDLMVFSEFESEWEEMKPEPESNPSRAHEQVPWTPGPSINPADQFRVGDLEVRKDPKMEGRAGGFGVWHLLLNEWLISGKTKKVSEDIANYFGQGDGELLLLAAIGGHKESLQQISDMIATKQVPQRN